MKFSKIGKHTIRCVISEQEIQDLGYTIEEIMSNGERTQEFMNQIFDMAEQSFETKFELGIKTVRADFIPEFTQFDSGKSMIRYFPPNGTAGFASFCVSAYNLDPWPPASNIATSSFAI